MADVRKRLRLGELLVQQGLLSEDQLNILVAEQRNTNIPIGRLIVRMGFATEAAVRDAMARTVGQESIDLSHVVADPEALQLVPQDFARRNQVLPIAYSAADATLTVATTAVFNVVVMDRLRALVGADIDVRPQIAAEAQVEECIDRFYGYELSVDGILKEIETGEIDYESLRAGGDEYTQPMVRLVNALLVDAVKRGASDVHFEPEYAFLRIRYRIDGVLETVRSLHKTFTSGITVRLKVISGMNIAEIRAPQDGRVSLTLNGRQVDFRVSTQPTIYGENLVLRVLDREKSIIRLENMALPDETMQKLTGLLDRPEGILIVTGPTGSGKTTTLYSLLAQINDDTVNIMTLEDPVEYPLNLLRQTSVNEVARMDFANGIRSMMRQDPDIILVGEMRDQETSEMAFRAAMTGHQVFTTLHTNSALGAFPRLLDLGIRPGIMAGNIIGIIAQRLVRLVCMQCREPYVATLEERRLLKLGGEVPAQIYKAVGCKACGGKGYKGRAPIMELLVMDGDLDELIARGTTPRELREVANSKGYKTLAQAGIRRILDGESTVAEISRVINLSAPHD
ncbi:MAG: secretion system protein E [Betaproteobacteria bacterium]|nr:secretion system protein E [Betaproteobacteria bacterium]